MAGPHVRFLIVGDDELTRRLSAELGREHVAVTALGLDAIAMIRRGDAFDIILCDLTAADNAGLRIYSATRTLAPSMAGRIVFLVGAGLRLETYSFLASVPNARFEKPVATSAIRELARAVLATTSDR